jgi:hypothetical protein
MADTSAAATPSQTGWIAAGQATSHRRRPFQGSTAVKQATTDTITATNCDTATDQATFTQTFRTTGFTVR